MLDSMNLSDTKKEIDFWLHTNELGKNFKHKNYYSFLDLNTISGTCLEIGCGGSPFTTYCDTKKDIDLTIVDPILKELVALPKYESLKQYKLYSCSLLDLNINNQFNHIVCLNVLDHFGNGHIEFLKRIVSLIQDGGKLFLYYDIRQKYVDNHYPVSHDEIISFLKQHFIFVKESFDINPKHSNWSTVYKSYRGIMVKQ